MDNKDKVDRRVLYTKMFLRESLLELMKEKPIGKITTTELCRRADINRNTFYSHYESPEALLHSIESELFNQIRLSVEGSWKNKSVHAFLTEICQAIFENGDLCRILFSDYGDKDFLRRIVHLAHDKSIAEWRALGISEEGGLLELLYTFSVNGSVAVIQQWLHNGMKYTPERIALFIEKASYSGSGAFMK